MFLILIFSWKFTKTIHTNRFSFFYPMSMNNGEKKTASKNPKEIIFRVETLWFDLIYK